MKAINRLFQYLDYKNIPHTRFEKEVGLSNGYLGTMLKREADIGESVFRKIIDKGIDISIHWLLTGEGDMILNSQTSLSGNQIAFGDNNNIIQGKKNKGTINYSGRVPQTEQGQSRSDCSEQELEIKYLKQKVKDQELLIEEKDSMIEEKERMIEEKERMIQLLLGNKGK